MSILFALIAAFGHAFDSFFVRKGLIETPAPVAATFITLTVNFIFFIILSLLFLPGHLLRLDLVYIFIIAGMLAPGFGRAFAYKGLETLGMSVSSPIVNSDSFFSITLALIFLDEPLTVPLAMGILGVMTGIILLSYEIGRRHTPSASRKFKRRYLFYPLTAAFLFGLSVFLRKAGLRVAGSPLLGAVFTSGTSWFIIALFMTASGHMKGVFQVQGKSLVYFFIAGGVNCVTWLALFQALHLGRVSIVSPISGCYCLITLLLSVVFLRQAERITATIVIATFLIVSGVVTLSLSR